MENKEKPYNNNVHLFKPGQSGNPNGRPKGTFSIVGMIKDKLQEKPEGQKETYAQLMVKKYFHKALVEGDDKTLRDLIDRIDGKAVQKMAGEMGMPIEFIIKKQE
jgi:hypothetical protein